MTYRIGVLMDPIDSIKPEKDSTLAMMLAAQARGWHVSVFTQSDLYIEDGEVFVCVSDVTLLEGADKWFDVLDHRTVKATEFDCVLMRKDPPFDMEYIYATYILERAENEGALIVNKPQSLRDCNEKLFTAWFPQCCVPNIVTRRQQHLRHRFSK